MSSLQCPARIFLARHGEAEYETALVTDDGGSLTRSGRAQARSLAERLRGERIARVWTSPLSRAVQTAEIVAGVLGVDVVVREGLREYGVGSLAGADGDRADVVGTAFRAWVDGDDEVAIPGAESIAAIVTRAHAVLGEIADAHPGEAVVVVAHGGVIQASLPGLLGRARSSAYEQSLPNGGFAELEADADGWRLVRWDLGHDEVRLS